MTEPSEPTKLIGVRLLAMDVDGVLTDGGVTLTADGAEEKRFNVADGLGLQLVMLAGIKVAWISGRASVVVERRARELDIDFLSQQAPNKSRVLTQLMEEHGLSAADVAHIGDDLNDLPAFSVVGVKFATANAVAEVKAVADFVTDRPGGAGAVREICDAILKAQDKWSEAATAYLARLLSQS